MNTKVTHVDTTITHSGLIYEYTKVTHMDATLLFTVVYIPRCGWRIFDSMTMLMSECRSVESGARRESQAHAHARLNE